MTEQVQVATGKLTLEGFFEEGAPEGVDSSGVFLLDEPSAALVCRLGLASLAAETLDLQYYLWKSDQTGGLLLHRALEAADRGVRVRLLIDDIFHTGRDGIYAALDAHPQIEVRLFNPIASRALGRGLAFLRNKRKLNHRMHNKIFLADGAAAVLGGRNIGDDYFGVDRRQNFRDLDVLAVGSAARQAGRAYDLYWESPGAVPIAVLRKGRSASPAELEALRSRLEQQLGELGALPYAVPVSLDEIRRPLEQLRRELIWADAQVIVDPVERFEGGSESAFVRLSRELNQTVETELILHSAYLIPNAEVVAQMAQLIRRGVRIRALTNSLMSNNHVSVHAHYAKYRRRMLEAGVELHELRVDAEQLRHLRKGRDWVSSSRAGLHTKAAVIDGKTTVIGSFNMDPRSRQLNSEIGLLIRSEEFAAITAQAMRRELEPANSYRLFLGQGGRIRWTGVSKDGPVEYRGEPLASVWARLAAGLIRWIPVEGEL